MNEINIIDLPSEILTKIFSYVKETRNFALTCRLFNEIARNNRVIKLDTLQPLRRINTLNYINYLIPINDCLIIIEKVYKRKQNLKVKKNNIQLYCRSIWFGLPEPLILSNIIGNTVIIFVSFNTPFKCSTNKDDRVQYLKNFNYIMSEIFNKHFSQYEYIIITMNIYNYGAYDNFRNYSINTYIKNYKIMNEIINIRFSIIPIYLTTEYIYFSNDRDICIYNYIKQNRKWLSICECVGIPKYKCCVNSVVKVYTNLLKLLDLPTTVVNNFDLLLNHSEINLKYIYLTNKYLAVYYSNIKNKTYIAVLNLQSYKKSIISMKYNRVRYLHLWSINNNILFISLRSKNTHSLYKVELN